MMTAKRRYRVTVARLPADLPAIHQIRRQVFVIEQGIPEHLECDGRDDACRHVLAINACDQPIGTGRLDPQGRIGRMAVLGPWRSRGVGRELLAVLLALARAQGLQSAVVHAQCAMAGFYRKAGFREQGHPFDEAGIVHQLMAITLDSDNNETTNGLREA